MSSYDDQTRRLVAVTLTLLIGIFGAVTLIQPSALPAFAAVAAVISPILIYFFKTRSRK